MLWMRKKEVQVVAGAPTAAAVKQQSGLLTVEDLLHRRARSGVGPARSLRAADFERGQQ
jgi:hypothetical protein